MITIRSLLPDALTACWMLLNSQRLANLRFHLMSRLAFFLERRSLGWLGRSLKPLRRIWRIDLIAAFSDVLWQTTRTSPGPAPVTADLSERAFGISPPAGGLTDVSGAGSGQ